MKWHSDDACMSCHMSRECASVADETGLPVRVHGYTTCAVLYCMAIPLVLHNKALICICMVQLSTLCCSLFGCALMCASLMETEPADFVERHVEPEARRVREQCRDTNHLGRICGCFGQEEDG